MRHGRFDPNAIFLLQLKTSLARLGYAQRFGYKRHT